MRLRKALEGTQSQAQPFPHPAAMARFVYNLLFWVFLLPLVTPASYGAGFIAFTVIITFRLLVNLYQNNVMEQAPDAFERQPFRFPLT